MCIRCVCRAVKEDVEENYISNREQIIKNLYVYFGYNDHLTKEELVIYERDVSEVNLKKHNECFEQLKEIQQMVESGEDEIKILINLEKLEGSMDFLQRHVTNEIDRKRGYILR